MRKISNSRGRKSIRKRNTENTKETNGIRKTNRRPNRRRSYRRRSYRKRSYRRRSYRRRSNSRRSYRRRNILSGGMDDDLAAAIAASMEKEEELPEGMDKEEHMLLGNVEAAREQLARSGIRDASALKELEMLAVRGNSREKRAANETLEEIKRNMAELVEAKRELEKYYRRPGNHHHPSKLPSKLEYLEEELRKAKREPESEKRNEKIELAEKLIRIEEGKEESPYPWGMDMDVDMDMDVVAEPAGVQETPTGEDERDVRRRLFADAAESRMQLQRSPSDGSDIGSPLQRTSGNYVQDAAVKAGVEAIKSVPLGETSMRISEGDVQELMSMTGFNEELARSFLEASDGSLKEAVSTIFSENEI